MTNGWEESASAWIAIQADGGDLARRLILDEPMLERARLRGTGHVLDVGCGEGRFCRLLASEGASVVGIDPAGSLIREARRLHPDGDLTGWLWTGLIERTSQAEGAAGHGRDHTTSAMT